jgi:hypothetical protein
MTKRKFYRTVIKVEVLSEGPIPNGMSLDKVNFHIVEGDCSGKVEWTVTNDEINGHVAAMLLREQGSDPGFFRLTDEGNDYEEEE